MRKILIVIFLIISLIIFYKINDDNYETIRKIKLNLVEHPEWLPKKEVAKISSFWFENLRADIFRLETIQYIWANALKSEYKVYLYKMLDLITDLNPYFTHPYKLWLLLLPNYNPRYENLDKQTQEQHKQEAIKIWLKWIKNLCDSKKIEAIKKENDLKKIWNNKKYENPCLDPMLPYYLAFDYYFYLKDPISSALYYKISSANKDSLKWARILSAIMQWKWGDRQKAFIMFITMAKAVSNDKESVCYQFSEKLENLWLQIFSWKIPLNWKLLKDIESLRKKFIGEYNQKDDIKEESCKNYLNKAVRELNLYYLETANKKYLKDNWKKAKSVNELFQKWYIDYKPIDYQQEEKSWIIYKYNPDTGNFDYEMDYR